jgi:adenylate cyclase
MSGKRHLAAIMFTDIVGYTAMMGADERNAFDLLEKNRAIQRPLIENYNGKWIKELGDGVMATFTNATDAVVCAALIRTRCADVPGLVLRIGIHLAEVVEQGGDVFGDGVNIAARLQAAAPADGIYISDTVQKNIANKRGITTGFISALTLKHVKEPVQVYKVMVEPELLQDLQEAAPAKVVQRDIPEKSIAVLPFENMSSDPEQEYFSDGMAEEILNALANIRTLKVVSRTSAFQYKGKQVDLRRIGEELGVRHVLEGSVRKQGSRIRITAQLIEVAHGYHLWSERYDRNIDDIFAIQDEIALAITEKLKITLLASELEQISKLPTVNTEAYEHYLKGRFFWNKRGKWLAPAMEQFGKAIALDPQFAAAYAGIADAYSSLGMYGIIPPSDAMPKAKAAAARAIAIDPALSEAFVSIAFINGFYEGDYAAAEENFRHAISINTHYATAHYWYSFYLSVVCMRYADAQQEGLTAIALEPYNAISYYVTGLAYLAEKNYEEAIRLAEKATEIDPALFLPYFLLGWCAIEKGAYNESVPYLEKAMELSNRHSWPIGYLVLAKMHSGKRSEAAALMAEIEERNKTQYFSVFGAAIAATAMGDNKKAIAFLEKGRRDRDTLLHIFRHTEVLPASLTGDPAFRAFMQQIDLSETVTA